MGLVRDSRNGENPARRALRHALRTRVRRRSRGSSFITRGSSSRAARRCVLAWRSTFFDGLYRVRVRNWAHDGGCRRMGGAELVQLGRGAHDGAGGYSLPLVLGLLP